MPYCCNCCSSNQQAKFSVSLTITDNSGVSPNISGLLTLIYDTYSGWWYYDSDYNVGLYCDNNVWKLDVWKTGGGTTTINLTCNSSTGKLSGSGGGYVISEFDYPCGCCPCCASGSQASSVSITFAQDNSYVPPDLVGTHVLDWNVGESAWKKTFNDGVSSVKLSCSSNNWQLDVVKSNEGSPEYFTSGLICTGNNQLKADDYIITTNPFDRPCLTSAPSTTFQINPLTINSQFWQIGLLKQSIIKLDNLLLQTQNQSTLLLKNSILKINNLLLNYSLEPIALLRIYNFLLDHITFSSQLQSFVFRYGSNIIMQLNPFILQQAFSSINLARELSLTYSSINNQLKNIKMLINRRLKIISIFPPGS
jgi:hypothetical protein